MRRRGRPSADNLLPAALNDPADAAWRTVASYERWLDQNVDPAAPYRPSSVSWHSSERRRGDAIWAWARSRGVAFRDLHPIVTLWPHD